MALTDDIQLLAKVPLFQNFSDDQLRLIAFGAEKRKIPAGQLLFREHSPAECAFVVASGQFDLWSTDRNEEASVKATVGSGCMLSELALFTLCERKYTAIAREDAEVIRVTRILFHRMVEEFPEVAEVVSARIKDNIAALAAEAAKMQTHFR